MARGATARKRRAQKRRIMRQGVSKAPAQDLVASVEPISDPVIEAAEASVTSLAAAALASLAAAAPATPVWDSEDGFMDLIEDLECALRAGKVPESENYRQAENPDEACCATCAAFDHGTCTMFSAQVDPTWVCDAYTSGDGGGDYSDDGEVALAAPASWTSWRVVDVALSADRAVVCCYTDGESEYYIVPFTIGSDREPVLSDKAEWQEVEKGWVTSSEAAAQRFAFASLPACANCDHAYTQHLGTTGPCTMGECGCEGYKGASEEAAVVDVDDLAAALAERTGSDLETARVYLTGFALETADVELPEAHQPADRRPRTRRGPNVVLDTPTPPAGSATGEITWTAVLCPEGKLTSDGRAFHPGAITWPRLDDGPLSLMAMTVTSEGGHVGAELCGRIDRIWRDEAANLIRAEGVFDSGDYGQEIARLVDDRTLRGVSVDLAIQRWERVPRSDWFDEDGDWAPKEGALENEVNPIDAMYGDDMISLILEAEIGMTTVCPFPAFADAQIGVGESLVASGGGGDLCWTVTMQAGMLLSRGDALTASAVAEEPCLDCEEAQTVEVVLTAAAAGLAPERPPREWFEDPGLTEPTAVEISEDGRIRGHAALWNVCHIGLPGQCRTAPHSNTEYAYFRLGLVECDDGEHVPVGQITIDAPHAGLGLDANQATSHYDHTGTVVGYVTVGEDEHGIWVAGTLAPNASDEKVLALKGAKLSGDWRGIEGNLELVALLAVNVPGFPVPRSRALVAAAGDGTGEVLSLTAAGITVIESELTEEDRGRFQALALQALASEAA